MLGKDGAISCTTGSWLIGAAVGLLALILLLWLTGTGFLLAVFLGVIVFWAVGYLISTYYCEDASASGITPGVGSVAAPRPAAPASAAGPASIPGPIPGPVPAPQPPKLVVAPTVTVVPAVTAAASVPVAPALPDTPPTPAPPPVVVPTRVVPGSVPVARPAEDLADGKPAMLTAARGGQADDLKIIRGIGPKLEQMLHGMGIFHFDQIGSWKAAELAWVDDNLEGFRGRASRDHWVAQAKVLASGGTEAEAFAAADAAKG